MSMGVKKGIRNSIALPTLSYASETWWTWNVAQQAQFRAVEMSYIKGACEISRWNLESNKEVYERFGTSATVRGVD